MKSERHFFNSFCLKANKSARYVHINFNNVKKYFQTFYISLLHVFNLSIQRGISSQTKNYTIYNNFLKELINGI